ncbi:hypothetical protein D9758_006544 [Tetrapyrgos nigripes]|uniref:Gylcosyl hydrolase 115 C-terminal domain-containing protein n=1 Tax=Tetrapyrgos nigripes TaxID=182062 RepID=A0A8H5LRH5_9AGAR|nr:hypothetical protein D9758_006544 [Tetrapyrgos nigripes]
MLNFFALALSLCVLASLHQVNALGQTRCVDFNSSTSTFAVVQGGNAAPILLAEDEWPGVQRAASDFAVDVERVTGVKPSVLNASTSSTSSSSRPIIIGTLGKSSLIDQVINATQLDVSAVEGAWEAFMGTEVENPLPGVDSAYVIVGADKRGTIFALYDLSEQFGVSPWYWWADVPVKKHSELFITPNGCAHGSPSVQYRGIFINDEQPGLTNWALEKFTNGTGALHTGSPFNHFFYAKLFELILRMKANYLWPAMWGSAFNVDDAENQPLADMFGVVLGTSHEEPWPAQSPSNGTYSVKETGIILQTPSLSTNVPLGEDTNIELLERIISDQRQILTDVYNGTDIRTIPQVWTLYKEVQGFYEDGMMAPDDVALLWSDDNWGNIRRFPLESERNRSGGSGVYYHPQRPGDNKNNCAQGYSCPVPTLTLDNFDPFANRYVDIGAGGPTPFTFTVSANVSWLKFSTTQGSISPDRSEQRVWISVGDWDQLEGGDIAAKITFAASATAAPGLTLQMRNMSVAVDFVATKNNVPAGNAKFTGFVEDGGAIAFEAAHASRNNPVQGIRWTEIPGLGRTLSGITPWPRSGADGANFTAGSGPSVEYDFLNFNTISESGNITVITYESPSLNGNGNDRPLGFAVQVDDLAIQSSYFMPPAAPGQLPSVWNDFVANSIVPVTMTFEGVEPGTHTLKIFMIEPAVVVQRVVIDTGGLKQSYFGPPESVQW